MKYRIAKDNEHMTTMTWTAFESLTWLFRKGAKEPLPGVDVLKEYGKVVHALFSDKTIIFAAEEELPF